MPLIIGILLGLVLYLTVGWIFFLLIFPWIGLSISLGGTLQSLVGKKNHNIGRRVTLLMIFPLLFLFVPIINNENFQLEGIVFLLTIGYFSKGIIHYAIAKVLGPFLFGRAFCGWACWTAAILEWLPIQKQGVIDKKLKNIRWITFFISVAVPLVLVYFYSYDVRTNYLNKSELYWMMLSNLIYYILAIPLAFIMKDRRAFCKILCPVSIVMKVTSRFSAYKIKPSGVKCIECGKCSKNCPMDIDVMKYISQGRKVTCTECIQCSDCIYVCPVKAIKG